MNEIAQLLQQKFGLTDQQAQEGEAAVIDLIKSKLPPEFQGVVGSLLGGGGADTKAQSGQLGGLLSMAEGFLGKKS
ncbi:MAG TPA: hypothetical protein VL990_05970 [Acidobacteriaceae bacterium]|nr:hypothetical protein [Acidobacteriaceae bacterium]